MKRLILVLLIGLLLLSGCGKPPEQVTVNVEKCSELQGKYDALLFNYESLKKSCDESRDWREQYNALVDDIRIARMENAVLQGQVQSLSAQYQAAVNALVGSKASDFEALEEMNRELEKEREYNRELNEQVQLVIDKKVALLSDNLTDAENKAFYKGWDLWWGTFHD